MKKLLVRKSLYCFSFVFLFAVVIWVGMFLIGNDGSIGDTGELTDEQMEQYYKDYAEMISEGDKENVLIVISDAYPDDSGAVRVIKGPNQTYYLMYESSEARDDAFLKYEADESVVVEKNTKMQLANYHSWGISEIGLDSAKRTIGFDGQPVKVAVIDTGLDVDLFREYYPDTELYTYDVENDTEYSSDMIDAVGHGTHVTGIIAEGIPMNASIYVIKASKGESEDIYSTDVTAAIYKAINKGADVINISLGANAYSASQKVALDYAKEQGVITVAAAGNESSSEPFYPAAYDSTFSISAVDRDLKLASYSNYGDTIDFAAPGTIIASINGIGSGTSMAAPHAAAAIATLKSLNRQLSFDDVRDLLVRHARDLGAPGKDQQFGYGLINFVGTSFCMAADYCDEYGVFAMEVPEFEIINRTEGIAEIESSKNGIVVAAEKACVVMVSYDDGETYGKVSAVELDGGENKYEFDFEINDNVKVMVVLKGDLDMHGSLNARDSAKIDYYLLSSDNLQYHDLNELELLIADVDNNGKITARDVSLLNYALLSTENPSHRELDW